MRWINNDDYPRAALREGRQGSVGFKLTVNQDGRIIDCQIMSSSGHDDLDAQTCRVLHRRARFTKTTDSPSHRYFESKFTWSIPR